MGGGGEGLLSHVGSLPSEWAAVVFELKNRPSPRSPSFTTADAVTKTFAGLISGGIGEHEGRGGEGRGGEGRGGEGRGGEGRGGEGRGGEGRGGEGRGGVRRGGEREGN